MKDEGRVVICPACGARGKVPPDKDGPHIRPTCKKCKTTFSLTDHSAAEVELEREFRLGLDEDEGLVII